MCKACEEKWKTIPDEIKDSSAGFIRWLCSTMAQAPDAHAREAGPVNLMAVGIFLQGYMGAQLDAENRAIAQDLAARARASLDLDRAARGERPYSPGAHEVFDVEEREQLGKLKMPDRPSVGAHRKVSRIPPHRRH